MLLLTPSVIAQMLNPFRGKKPVIVPTTIQLTNPFGARLDITRVEMEVIINDTVVVGRAIQRNMNITVPRYVGCRRIRVMRMMLMILELVVLDAGVTDDDDDDATDVFFFF